jgi:hypothetical protein
MGLEGLIAVLIAVLITVLIRVDKAKDPSLEEEPQVPWSMVSTTPYPARVHDLLHRYKRPA